MGNASNNLYQLLAMFVIKGGDGKQKRANDRMMRIKDVLNKALGEVRDMGPSSRQDSGNSSGPFKRRSDESSESQSINEVLNHLRKGYLMTKHSINTKQPHNKFVYLSKDNRFVCWKSLDKQDQKRMEIGQIQQVVKEGAEFYIKASKDIRDLNHCVVICSKSRNLELEAASQLQAQIFKDQLMRAIRYSKGMSFNYEAYSKS